MPRYIFYTKTDTENVKMHTINADTCKIAYEILKASGYKHYEISLCGWKEEYELLKDMGW